MSHLCPEFSHFSRQLLELHTQRDLRLALLRGVEIRFGFGVSK